MGEWRLNKEIPFSAGWTARFYTLWEDQRDMMCDSVRPEMGVSMDEKNRRVSVDDNRLGITIWSQRVSRNEGNRMYLEMKPLDHFGYGRAQCYEWLVAHGANI